MFFDISLIHPETHMGLSLFRVHLKETLSEETVTRMVSFFHEHLFPHIIYGEIAPFSVLLDRLGEFFGEDATVSIDANLEWYGPNFLMECISEATYLPSVTLAFTEEGHLMYRQVECSPSDGPWVLHHFRRHGFSA